MDTPVSIMIALVIGSIAIIDIWHSTKVLYTREVTLGSRYVYKQYHKHLSGRKAMIYGMTSLVAGISLLGVSICVVINTFSPSNFLSSLSLVLLVVFFVLEVLSSLYGSRNAISEVAD